MRSWALTCLWSFMSFRHMGNVSWNEFARFWGLALLIRNKTNNWYLLKICTETIKTIKALEIVWSLENRVKTSLKYLPCVISEEISYLVHIWVPPPPFLLHYLGGTVWSPKISKAEEYEFPQKTRVGKKGRISKERGNAWYFCCLTKLVLLKLI